MLATPIIERSSLRDQALAVIREGLVSGDLKPGEIYSATALASSLGISASPVREAMLTLANQGLVEAVRNRGFRVIPLSDNDRREIFELRMMIEVPATQGLAGNEEIIARADQFKAIADEIVAAAKAGDLIAYLDADRRFHLGLLQFGNNGRLVAMVDELRDNTRLFGLRDLHERGSLTASAEEHAPILNAVVGNDPELTGELMRRHLTHICGDWS